MRISYLRRTDRRTDGQTDRRTDGEKSALVELRFAAKKYRSIPILTFPNENLRGISAGELFTQELVQKVEAKCQNCPYWLDNARISVKTGEHTAFVVTRRGYLNPDGTYKRMLRTKITDMRKQCAGEKFLRDLICVISHQGAETGGHFVCYSKVDDTGVWYRNSDRTECEQSPHPFHSRKKDEDLLIEASLTNIAAIKNPTTQVNKLS